MSQQTLDGGLEVQYPLSPDEHAAMTRYVSGLRSQLRDVSDLFATRYGTTSCIAELALKTLISATMLEHELLHECESAKGSVSESIEIAVTH